MNHDILIAKLQKLLALAQRGEDGEAVNARALLNKMLSRYGIDEASLTDIRTLRYATDNDTEKDLLIVVASFALQIPTAHVEVNIVVRKDDLGVDLTLTVEQHGLVAALFEHHRIGLDKSAKQLATNQDSKRAKIEDEIKTLTNRAKTLKVILGNFEKTARKATDYILSAYVNLNNLNDYAGWQTAAAEGTEAIHSAMASCVQMDTNPNQLPAQRLSDN